MNEDTSFYDQLKLDCMSYNNNTNVINANPLSNLLNSIDLGNYKMVELIFIKVILVRKDLKMGVGKIAAQVGHAGYYCFK